MGQEIWEELEQQQGGGFASLVRVGWMQIWPKKPRALCVAYVCPFTSWPCPASTPGVGGLCARIAAGKDHFIPGPQNAL